MFGFLSSQSNYWAGRHWLLYKIHFLSHITIRSRNGLLLLHRISEEDTSKWQFFWFAVSSWGTHLSSFFTFPIYFKCQTTIEWSTLSSWGTSHVVLRGSARTDHHQWFSQLVAFNLWWSVTARLSSPLQNFLNHHCTVRSLAVPDPHGLLMLQVVSAALWPILNLNKKVARICFFV